MGKLVRTISGRMVDLALDIRLGSPTFGKIVAHDMPSSAIDRDSRVDLGAARVRARQFLHGGHGDRVLLHGRVLAGVRGGRLAARGGHRLVAVHPGLRESSRAGRGGATISDKDREGASVRREADAEVENFRYYGIARRPDEGSRHGRGRPARARTSSRRSNENGETSIAATRRRRLHGRSRPQRARRDEHPDAVSTAPRSTMSLGCEDESRPRHRVNANAVEALARACEAIDAKLMTVSTDYVFDGTKVGRVHRGRRAHPAQRLRREQARGRAPRARRARTDVSSFGRRASSASQARAGRG